MSLIFCYCTNVTFKMSWLSDVKWWSVMPIVIRSYRFWLPYHKLRYSGISCGVQTSQLSEIFVGIKQRLFSTRQKSSNIRWSMTSRCPYVSVTNSKSSQKFLDSHYILVCLSVIASSGGGIPKWLRYVFI